MNPPPGEQSPLALAYLWVGRIFAICGEMILPSLGGLWLDQKLGTNFLVVIGLLLGLAVAGIHLVGLATAEQSPRHMTGDPAQRLDPPAAGPGGQAETNWPPDTTDNDTTDNDPSPDDPRRRH